MNRDVVYKWLVCLIYKGGFGYMGNIRNVAYTDSLCLIVGETVQNINICTDNERKTPILRRIKRGASRHTKPTLMHHI